MNSKGGLFVAGLAMVGGSYFPGMNAETAQAMPMQPNELSAHLASVAMPQTLDPTETPTTVAAPECAPKVTSKGEISKKCADMAAALIKSAGYYNLQSYQQANGITDYGKQSPNMGVATYNFAMSGAKLNVTSSDPSDHVVVDISDQLGTFFKGGRAALIAQVSTGSGKDYTYTDKSGKLQHSKAITPLGTSKIYATHDQHYFSQTLGGRDGSMAWALAFNGGVDLHTGNLPGHPASHGCVRFPKGHNLDGKLNPLLDAVKEMRDMGLGIGDKVTIQP